MKRLLLFLFVTIVLNANAQIDTIQLPSPIYISYQKNFLRVSPDDHIFVSFRGHGLGEYDGSTWTMFTDTNGLSSNEVTSIAFDNLIRWFGTGDGLMKQSGINLLSFRTNNSPMPSNHVNCVYMGDTSLWVGTDAGAVSISNNYWVIFDQSDSPVLSDTILEISSNPFGVYFVTNNGISIKKSVGWSTTTPNVGVVDRFTKNLSGSLYWKNYSIRDSVFKIVDTQSDPCLFNSLITQPYSILGEPVSNSIYTIINPPNNFYIVKSDSSFHLTAAYNNLYFGNYLELFDFDPNAKLVLTENQNVIYRIDLQTLAQIQHPSTCPYLDINMVNARIQNNGSNFWNHSEALYEVPKGSGKTTIYTEGMWLGGKDDSGNVHVAAHWYEQYGTDFWSGPLDTTDASINLATSQQYDSVWKINKYDVDYFIGKFLDGSVANGSYIIPDIILNWPVSGTGNITRNLAPWVDYNSDGIYNPYDGDYPDVKGDQMIWWVFNDNLRIHGETDSARAMGVEIHAMAYAYYCPNLNDGDSVINYTTFYHYDVYNRSDTNYHDFYNGLFTDMELGYYNDDYDGCDTSIDISYVYNGDNDDEGSYGYGLNPPIFNLAYLRGADPNSSDGIDNDHDGAIDEAGEKCMMNNFIFYSGGMGATEFATTGQEYYNYLTGRWRFGDPVTYGGYGYNPGSVDTVHYMFSGDPYDSLQWSDMHPGNGNTPQPGARQNLISSGPYDLPAHGKQSFDYAYVYTRDPDNPNGPNSFALNRDQVSRIKHFFETDSFPCQHLIGIDEVKNNISLNVYPNPAHSNVHVTIGNASGKINYELRNLLGEIILSSESQTNSFDLAVNNFPPGIYFLIVKTKFGDATKKIIIN